MASLYESLISDSQEDNVYPFPARGSLVSEMCDLNIGKAIVALYDGNQIDRIKNIRLLGDFAFFKKIKIPEVVGPLIALLKWDRDPSVREEIAWAVWKLGDRRASEALLHVLANDESVNVRERAARALGLLGVKKAVPFMLALLSLGRFLHAKIRAALVASLGVLAEEKAIKILLRAAKDPEPTVRNEAVKALGYYLLDFKSEIAKKAFEQIIRSVDPYRERISLIRRAAVEGLRICNDPRALKTVAKTAVNDPDAETRRLAVESLLCFDGEISENALIEALKDSNWSVRKSAARVLAATVKRPSVYNTPRVCEALTRIEHMFPSGSREWRLAAEAFAGL